MHFSLSHLATLYSVTAVSQALSLPFRYQADADSDLIRRAASATDCAKNIIVNGGFESGQLSPWSSLGGTDGFAVVQPGYKDSQDALSIVVPPSSTQNIEQKYVWCNGSTYDVEFFWKFTGTKNDTKLSNMAVYMGTGHQWSANSIAPGKWHKGNFTIAAGDTTSGTIEFVWANENGPDALSFLLDSVSAKIVK